MRKLFIFCLGLNLWLLGTAISNKTQASIIPIEAAQVKANRNNLTGMKVKNLNMTAPLKPGGVSGEKWVISEDAAYYVTVDEVLVIYGHNYTVFKTLNKINKNDEIELADSEGIKINYKVEKIEKVTPDKVEVIKSAGPGNLILITCTGNWDTYRLVVTALPEQTEN